MAYLRNQPSFSLSPRSRDDPCLCHHIFRLQNNHSLVSLLWFGHFLFDVFRYISDWLQTIRFFFSRVSFSFVIYMIFYLSDSFYKWAGDSVSVLCNIHNFYQASSRHTLFHSHSRCVLSTLTFCSIMLPLWWAGHFSYCMLTWCEVIVMWRTYALKLKTVLFAADLHASLSAPVSFAWQKHDHAGFIVSCVSTSIKNWTRSQMTVDTTWYNNATQLSFKVLLICDCSRLIRFRCCGSIHSIDSTF